MWHAYNISWPSLCYAHDLPGTIGFYSTFYFVVVFQNIDNNNSYDSSGVPVLGDL